MILLAGCVGSLTFGFLFCLILCKIKEEKTLRELYSTEWDLKRALGEVQEREEYIIKCYAGALLPRFNKMIEQQASEHKIKCMITNFMVNTESKAFEDEEYIISFVSLRNEIYEGLMDS